MTRCDQCEGSNKCLPPSGPAGSRLLFVGEAPGKEEQRKGEIFIGKTGEELNRGYLPICNLRRENVRVINAISCLPPGTGKLNAQREKDTDLLMSCSEHHLYPEIERSRPELIVPMGAFACRAIDPDINLELQHGFPVQTRRGTAFPMYHPAGGIHEPKKMLQIRTDWTRLNKYLKHKLRIPVDQFEGKEQYEHLTKPSQVVEVLSSYHTNPLACDTESTRRREPFCLTFSAESGTGFLIKADDLETLAAFQGEISNWRAVILWHNWLYDMDVVRKMGLVFPRHLIRDTMVMAYHLGNIPQGLKALAYRLLGMQMQDFDDLVLPYSTDRVLEYYRQCLAEDWGKPEEQTVRGPDGKWKLYKPQGFNAKIKRFFGDYTKNPEKDIYEMWQKNWSVNQEEIQGKIGEWPGKCITYAAEDNWPDTLRYACRDADATLRLYPALKAMQHNVRRTVAENWGDLAA